VGEEGRRWIETKFGVKNTTGGGLWWLGGKSNLGRGQPANPCKISGSDKIDREDEGKVVRVSKERSGIRVGV